MSIISTMREYNLIEIEQEGVIRVEAYMLNNYYIFTNYNELSSHIYDILHHSLNNFSFSVERGQVNWDKMIFVNEDGKSIPLMYESEDDFYFSMLAN